VVIALVVILASLLFPVLSRAKTAARFTQCLNNLHQLGLAEKAYVDDNSGFYQMDWSEYWYDPLAAYLNVNLEADFNGDNKPSSVFACPPTLTFPYERENMGQQVMGITFLAAQRGAAHSAGVCSGWVSGVTIAKFGGNIPRGE
jgi:type II secretory pathway pseudopilin PulG